MFRAEVQSPSFSKKKAPQLDFRHPDSQFNYWVDQQLITNLLIHAKCTGQAKPHKLTAAFGSRIERILENLQVDPGPGH